MGTEAAASWWPFGFDSEPLPILGILSLAGSSRDRVELILIAVLST
jgi:hypothetical protein